MPGQQLIEDLMSELNTDEFFKQLQQEGSHMPDDLGDLDQEVSERLGQMVPAEPEPLNFKGYRDNPHPAIPIPTTWQDRLKAKVQRHLRPMKLWLLKKLYITCLVVTLYLS
jgi:hypothetical protein